MWSVMTLFMVTRVTFVHGITIFMSWACLVYQLKAMENKQEVYEVSELHEYEEDKGFEPFVNDVVGSSMQKSSVSFITKLVVGSLVVAAFALLLLILVLQIVIIVTPSNDNTQAQLDKLVSMSEDAARRMDNMQTCVNNTEDIEQILETTGNSAQKLVNIVNTLSNQRNTSTSTAGVVDDILLVVQELLVLHNDSSALPTSCKQIKAQRPSSPSGVYVLATGDGTNSYNTYCNMDELCGSGGGWTRLGYLDMTDATQDCPSGFRLYQSGSVRACGRPVGGASCVSTHLSSKGLSYSQICGRVTGYQFGSTNAIATSTTNINSYYVDGVSITRGSPRQHVWTLMSGLYDSHQDNYNNCPCGGSIKTVPSFIGGDYFCESGNPTTGWQPILYNSDPVWDGQGCGSLEGSCCSASGLPWFHRDYGTHLTSDSLELRLCGDQDTNNEDNPISFYEIFVK